ncbi:MAG: iron-containing alcohol dehydrogenase [Bacillota bacterium]
MINNFSFSAPVAIEYGVGVTAKLADIASSRGYTKGVLVSDKLFATNGTAEKIMASCPALVAMYSDITPNPMLQEVRNASKLMKEVGADFVVALGGGSAMDLAKFASAMVNAEYDVTEYFYKRQDVPAGNLPLIAIPTTAGTGSEMTAVSVCNDEATGIKSPLNHKNFYASVAVIDPMLTLSVPPFVTATTGLDALSHALEAFWCASCNPISDGLAEYAIRLVFENLETAFNDGSNVDARGSMMLASLIAGISFAPTRTAGVHGCSYPLSIDYHLCHGEACAFTLDSFIKVNATAGDKLNKLAKRVGFSDAVAMADEVARLKKVFKLKTTLSDVGITDVDDLAKKCSEHPLLSNNVPKMSASDLADMFNTLK